MKCPECVVAVSKGYSRDLSIGVASFSVRGVRAPLANFYLLAVVTI